MVACAGVTHDDESIMPVWSFSIDLLMLKSCLNHAAATVVEIFFDSHTFIKLNDTDGE